MHYGHANALRQVILFPLTVSVVVLAVLAMPLGSSFYMYCGGHAHETCQR